MSSHPEKDGIEVRYVDGYPSLADFIASDRDHSTFIFKRFDSLSARNLLYLQGELSELEELQNRFDLEDYRNIDPIANHGRRDWTAFKQRASSQSRDYPDDKKRMDLALEIRAKLREYKKTILLDSALLSMRRPTKQAHQAFQKHFWHGDQKHPFPTLQGSSRTTSARRIKLVSTALNVMFAAALLFGAIFNLYYVENRTKRLGMLAGYTIAFALCITLLANARCAEIFSASAAYAAVLVVFVSGDLG
ncbi:hypothetical protein BDV19DRAFT_385584 [Aspergillus venezuelensis]